MKNKKTNRGLSLIIPSINNNEVIKPIEKHLLDLKIKVWKYHFILKIVQSQENKND